VAFVMVCNAAAVEVDGAVVGWVWRERNGVVDGVLLSVDVHCGR
jgi:hypothetical protein